MKAPYFVTGPVGAGKSVTMVSIMVGYLNEGRPVATNIDVYPEHMPLNEKGKATPIIRLPEEPRSSDLENLGYAYERPKKTALRSDQEQIYDESKNGCLALDETAFFMNTRDWNNPDRAQLIKWLRLVRKRGWNAFLGVQDIESIDKQIVNALCRTICWCYSSDTMFSSSMGAKGFLVYPLIWIARLVIKFGLRVPRVHVASYFKGKSKATGSPCGTKYTWGRWLYKAYDTAQEFDDGKELFDFPIRDSKGLIKCRIKLGNGDYKDAYLHPDAIDATPDCERYTEPRFVDMRACYSILPAKYIHQWYGDKPVQKAKLSGAVASSRSTPPVYEYRFPITNPLQIPRWAIMRFADHVARRQNIPMIFVLLRWGIVNHATAMRHPEFGKVVRRNYWLRKYGLKSRLNYYGQLTLSPAFRYHTSYLNAAPDAA